MSQTETEDQASGTSLRELLAAYDERVRRALAGAAGTTTGTDRVRALHLVRRVLAAHDSVVVSTLCPLLEDLPAGPGVADRLRLGCEGRASLLARFQSLSQGTEPHNVYPVFGPEIEAVLDGLRLSFERHVDDETSRVGELLESAAASVDPEVVAARMAIESASAPVRAHRVAYRHPRSRVLRSLLHNIDRMHDWNDSHHGWPSSPRRASPPVRPARRYSRRPPSIPDVLSGYDETVESIIGELSRQRSGPQRAAAAYRLGAAIAVHDSIVAGTLCRLLDAVPEGRDAAGLLRRGCEERAVLLGEWNDLVEHASPRDLFETHAAEADTIVEALIASFRDHEGHETGEVAAVVERLRQRHWKYGGTGLISPYLLPSWPNPEPGVLAAHMALWGDKSPTRVHPLLARHPANRLLRDVYRYADRLRDWRQARHGWPAPS